MPSFQGLSCLPSTNSKTSFYFLLPRDNILSIISLLVSICRKAPRITMKV